MIQLDGITNSTDLNVSKLQEIVKDKESWRAAGHRVSKGQTQLSDRQQLPLPLGGDAP